MRQADRYRFQVDCLPLLLPLPSAIAYRNWMNSMGVRPFVNYLYSDLSDGLIIFQLYDIIQAGTVDWSRVNQKFAKIRAFMQKIGEGFFSLKRIFGHYLRIVIPDLNFKLALRLWKSINLTK